MNFSLSVTAYATNPSDASFRAHLTDLSFRLHLKRLQAAEPEVSSGGLANSFSTPGEYKHGKAYCASSSKEDPGQSSKDKHRRDGLVAIASPSKDGASASKSAQNHKYDQKSPQNGDGRPHVLSFSNRVSISLKTPSYVRSSYVLFSTVKILPSPLPPNKGSVRKIGSSASSGRGKTMSSASSSGRKTISSGRKVTKKGGFVSSLASNFAQFSSNPWVEQGGYFIGILGSWWTIDDGTSLSGARQKARLKNAILAVEEQDEEEETLEAQKPDEGSARSPRTLEDGPPSPLESVHKSNTVVADLQTSHANGEVSNPNNPNTRQKHLNRLANSNNVISSFRGGQRRSSPTPRAVTPITAAKIGKKPGSGESTPTLPVAATVSPIGSAQPSYTHRRNRADVLDTDADKDLPGLPFHIDASSAAVLRSKGTHGQHVGINAELPGAKDRDNANTSSAEDLSTVSHSASAPETEVSSVTPACALLQNQLDDLRSTSEATQSRLQSELEDLRSRRLDEDAVRMELKSRTRSLEEAKRSAEQERQEAERKLISARATKKAIEDRVGKARSELSKLEKRERESEEKSRKAQKDREDRLVKLKEQVKQSEGLLKKEVEATERIADRVEQLESEIEDRKNDLQGLREGASQAARFRMSGGRSSHANANAGFGVVSRHLSNSIPSPNLSALFEHASPSLATAPTGGSYGLVGQSTGLAGHEDSANPPSPARTPPGFVSGSSVTSKGLQKPEASSTGPDLPPSTAYGPISTPIPSSFLEHRMQHRRAPVSASGNPVSSSVNTSVIGSSASAASALYNRHLRDSGSTIMPTSTSAFSGGTSMHHDGGAILGTFAPFGPNPGSLSLIEDSTSSTCALGVSPPLVHVPYFASDNAGHVSPPADSQAGNAIASGASGSDDVAPTIESPTDGVTEQASPISLSGVESASSGIIGTGRHLSNTRVEIPTGVSSIKADKGSSFMDGGNSPLSPMTPHQTSLIPSQLFDLLDEVEMPAVSSLALSNAHHAFTQAIDGSRADNGPAAAFASWEDDSTYKPSLSRKPSHNRGNFSPNASTASTVESAASPLDGMYPQGGQTEYSGSVSPLMASATTQSSGGGSGSLVGRALPHDLLFDKARHVLSLNPDAKAFSFNRPLPSSGSVTHIARGGQIGDGRLAFEHGSAFGNGTFPLKHGTGSGSSSSLTAAPWASPVPGSRNAPAGGNTTASAHTHAGSAVSGQSQAQGHGQRSTSGPAAGSTFSPFDDDDLLRGW
ncbi:MAG: hypothetical protein CYPHOPRED_002043 [Cyphobasidiales sp. Tagirdzhanova-0007]|nr:MAG: hypothetical protein CYPHOPRED_002043 [Cyphobasidiales sp. Tagirdzhanova-0007]